MITDPAARTQHMARRIFGFAVLSFLFPSCDGGRAVPDGIVRDTLGAVAGPSLLDGVREAAIPAATAAACDTAFTALRPVHGDFARRDGAYRDTFHGDERIGCRLVVDAARTAASDPHGASRSALRAVGWSDDLRFSADGPDGGSIGMRRRGVLCIIAATWTAPHDDADTAAAATGASHAYTLVTDCAVDAVDPASVMLPEWAVTALTSPDFEASFAISPRLRMPPFIEGDFDGDTRRDVLVLVEDRATGRQGVAIVSNDPARVPVIFGAGQMTAGAPADLAWVDEMQPMHAGSSTVGVDVAVPSDMIGDGMFFTGGDRATAIPALLYWNGTGFVYLESSAGGL